MSIDKRLKPRAILKSFLSDKDTLYYSNENEYTNTNWLLKSEYLPKKLKERINTFEVSKLIYDEARRAWDLVLSKPLRLVRAVYGYDSQVENMDTYICKLDSSKDIDVAISKIYYDYLNRNIPDFYLMMSENPINEASIMVIYSGIKKVGLLMSVEVEYEYIVKLKNECQEEE